MVTRDSYYLYNPVSGKISHSRNVSFNEKEFIGLQNIEAEDYEFLPEFEYTLDFDEGEAKPLNPLKPVVEKFDSPTQESLPNQDSFFLFKFYRRSLCGLPHS